MKKTIKNPDIQKIYHAWHYCSKCGKVFDHSQGTWDGKIKPHCWKHDKKDEEYEIKDVSTDINEIEINLNKGF